MKIIGYVIHRVTKKPDVLLIRQSKAGAIKAFEYQLCLQGTDKEFKEYKEDCRRHKYKMSEVFINGN